MANVYKPSDCKMSTVIRELKVDISLDIKTTVSACGGRIITRPETREMDLSSATCQET